MFRGGLLVLLGLGNRGLCGTASQPNQLNSYMGHEGGEAQAVMTLILCCHRLAAQLLEGRPGFVTVAK